MLPIFYSCGARGQELNTHTIIALDSQSRVIPRVSQDYMYGKIKVIIKFFFASNIETINASLHGPQVDC